VIDEKENIHVFSNTPLHIVGNSSNYTVPYGFEKQNKCWCICCMVSTRDGQFEPVTNMFLIVVEALIYGWFSLFTLYVLLYPGLSWVICQVVLCYRRVLANVIEILVKRKKHIIKLIA
jgi:hypothetical protein